MAMIFTLNMVKMVLEVPLFVINSVEIQLTFYVDEMSLMFMSFVLIISSAVLLFSSSYMSGDYFVRRFIWMVILFVLSMLLLITSLNMVSLILGWDGLGVVSYILVIYYQNEKSNAAGMITALTNRLGDVAILVIIGMMVEVGSWNFMFLTEMEIFKSMYIVPALIILASMTKSAQMPFSAWLPAAMAAPTPVSALVHSSTLVTAGVYLLIRFYPIFESLNLMKILFLTASLTTCMASLSALYECDLKKIVALSTLSQLGVMVATLSLGFPLMAFFHLLTHATFKALLFMCSGKIIYEMKDSQDIRAMGFLCFSLPITGSFFNLANLALCGFPFLAGFYSKDILMEKIIMMDLSLAPIILLCLMVSLSSAYSVRLTVLGLLKPYSSNSLSKIYEEDPCILGSYAMLGALALSSGAIMSWMIFPSPSLISLPTQMKLFTLIMMMTGVFLGFLFSLNLLGKDSVKMSEFLSNMWLLTLISGPLPSNLSLSLNNYLKSLDLGWAELFGGKGGFLFLTYLSRSLPLGFFSYVLTYQLLGGVAIILMFMLIYLDSLNSTRRWKRWGKIFQMFYKLISVISHITIFV
uniref:NADH-ubiquinone oxidoreductase chain 5 n=1 Tax=Bragasellus molinai TaxID=1281925 RepID=A0A485M719_9CRUS|nr:NADH dehydrogenase subunit 5 [Bragasellus molinai]